MGQIRASICERALAVAALKRGADMRPVDKGGPHRKYQIPATLTFSAAESTTVGKVVSGTNLSVDDYLVEWLNIIKQEANTPPPTNLKELRAARKVIADKVGDIYKQAAAHLVERIGEYCSYCETYVPGLLEVEHAVPKAQFPTFATAWKNFLLACGACNVKKGSHPTRSELRNWRNADITLEDDCYDDIRNQYVVWPDIAQNTTRKFFPRLFHDANNTGQWQIVSVVDAIDTDNVITSVDIATRSVKADLPTLGLSDVPVELRIETTNMQSENRLVDLCKLNDKGAQNTTHDRRLINRTRAWFAILKSVKSLLKMKSRTQFDASWTMLCGQAVSQGYFCLWLQVLKFHRDPSSSGQTLADRLIADTPNDFPNTVTAFLP
jgi:5-methylcytosine-specific restriction endonuclease McrA